MRFVAPPRDAIDRTVFALPPLSAFAEYAAFMQGAAWPDIGLLEQSRARAVAVDDMARPAFAAQTPELLADGLHYETRVVERGVVATRVGNWHDLFNALVWLRHAEIKAALNARQVADIARVGAKTRTRGQCALTHFDEAGAIVWLADSDLLAAWDAHAWRRLFHDERATWGSRVALTVFGHALLEFALTADALPVAKALVVRVPSDWKEFAAVRDGLLPRCVAEETPLAAAIRGGELLADPLELRPLPLAGLPGRRAEANDPGFFERAPCFRPLPVGRRYPAPLHFPDVAVGRKMSRAGRADLP